MKNFGKIISDKDIITKEYLDSKGYISAITSKMVTDALGFTPFDSAAFTKASIKNALGIADWALAANKPSYDDVYLKLTGGTIAGNLKVIGGFRAESQHGHYINFDGFSLTANAGLKVVSGYSLSLAGESITSWAGLKNYLSFAFSDIGSKPTTLSGYGITDAMAIGPIISAGQDLNNYKTPGSYMLVGGGILNQPVGDGTMLVMAASNKYFTSQLVIGYNGVIYTRMGESQSWTDWKVLADSSQLTLGEQSITTWSDLKSILGFIEIAQASEHRATTDNSAFATYSYGDNGWKVAGPALAFANGGYKGLLNISIGSGESYPTHLWISSVREGTQQPWVEVLTEANISSLAMVAGQAGIESGQDLNDLFIPGSYHIAGGPTNAPNEAGDGSLLVVATKHRVFSSQLLVGWNGVLYLRGAEGNSWKDWRTVLDTTNIGTTSLPSLNLNGETITSWAEVRTRWAKSWSSVNSNSAQFDVNENYKKYIVTTLTNIHTITFNLLTVGTGISEWICCFTTGNTTPTINLIGPNLGEWVWQNGVNILNNLEPNTQYRLHIDGNMVMYTTFK